MRSVAAALLLTAVLVPAVAHAAPSPAPTASGVMERKVPLSTTYPGTHHRHPSSIGGAGCIAAHPNADQTAINPITGKPQAADIVSIPVTGGNVADSTARAQQAHACAHPRN
jgi:hypothetical protein